MSDQEEFSADSLSEALLERIPELRDSFEEETAFWQEYGTRSLGPDALFSLVLAPFVIERLNREDPSSDEVLHRVFAFLETLAQSEDDILLSVVDVSFGEALLADTEAFDRAKQLMGPRLRETFDFIVRLRDSLPKRYL